MGHKSTEKKVVSFSSFPFRQFLLSFVLYFFLSLLALLAIAPWLSFLKLTLVRLLILPILGYFTPYIHPVPFYRHLSLALPVFSGLFFAYRSLPLQHSTPPKNNAYVKFILGLLLLWFLEVGAHVLEITVTRMEYAAFLPNFILTVLLSIGPIGFPLLLWIVLFHPSFLD